MSAKEEICGRMVFFAVIGFMFGSIWWSYDIVMSMKHGSWTVLHFGDLLLKIGLKNFVKWVYYPNDWIGLSRMLKYILEMSSGFVVMALSAIVFFFGAAVHD